MNEANKVLLEDIKELKEQHPAWGYRRVWAYLKYRKGLPVNHKRVYRLMKSNNLMVPRNLKLRSKREAKAHKPKTIEPNRIWGMDMTKILIPSYGWAYLHIVLDWGSKKIVGWNLRPTSKSEDWLDSLHLGLNKQFPNGVREATKNLMLVTDNGCQPTSQRFDFECRKLNLEHIFTSYCNPKGNADTERVIRTIKEDLIWPRDWHSFEEMKKALIKWIDDYNKDYPHMTLGYMTPYQYEQWFKYSCVA